MCLTGDFANLDDGCCYNVAVLGIPQCSSACGTGGNCCGLEQAAHSHDKARVRTQVERIDSVTKAATNFRSSPDAGQPPAGLPRLRRAMAAWCAIRGPWSPLALLWVPALRSSEGRCTASGT